MNLKELSVVIVRVFALYALFYAVNRVEVLFVPFYIHVYGGPDEHRALQFILTSVPFVLLLFIAYLFWAKAERIAGFVFRLKPERESNAISLSAEDLHSVIFSFAGLLLVCNALPTLFANIASHTAQGTPNPMLYSDWIRIWMPLTIKLVLGIILLFGSKGISTLVRKTRGR